jgi:hypothetical protein
MHRDCRRTFFTDDGVHPLAPSVRSQTRVVALASTHSSDTSPRPCRLYRRSGMQFLEYHSGGVSVNSPSLSASPMFCSM